MGDGQPSPRRAVPAYEEIARGERFAFGENWARFLRLLDDARITRAEQSLRSMLGVERLDGKGFLDIGSGSGLFSLAARRLGARVRSFDFDAVSVSCGEELRRRYFPDDRNWTISRGSVLDSAFVESLAPADVVYSWGVLHHTGEMWRAIELSAGRVRAGGMLFIAIYNDQGGASRRWRLVKRAYNALPRSLRWLVLIPGFVRLWGPTFLSDALRGRPFRTWRKYSEGSRGMSAWRDVVDWIGGLPFEVAKPEEILHFLQPRGFTLANLTTAGGGLGCNEFVFRRSLT